MSLPEMEPAPGYVELFSRASSTVLRTYRECTDCGLDLAVRTLLDHAYIKPSEILLFVLCVVMWTGLRWALTKHLFLPFANWCHFQPKEVVKMPESSWKMVFYTMSWSYSTYLLFFCNYAFFQNPSSAFDNWRSGMPVPIDIAIAYLIQGSFYGHSIYAVVYMDEWRKDSVVMLLHHVITLALLSFSYAFRYHNIGILVLFLHDINDIQLEFIKLNIAFKSRGGKYYMINDVLATFGFVSFGVTWFWFRLYWFPLKVLYASCLTSQHSVPNIPFYFFFNALLFALLLMNIYWFLFIVQCVIRVLTGQSREVNDTREYEEQEDKKSLRTKGNHSESQREENHLQNGVTKEKHQ